MLVLGLLSNLADVYLVEWVVLGFVALLIHELGHALAFRRYGVASSITFWLLGGFTVPTDQAAAARLNDRQLLVVSIAGPLFGLAVGAASLAVAVAVRSQSAAIRVPLFLWLFVNLGWAVFNLMPISSLDGGQALRHLAGAAFGRRGRAAGLALGLLASVAIVVVSADFGLYTIAIVAAVFGLFNPTPYLELREELWPTTPQPPELEPEPASTSPAWASADEGFGRADEGLAGADERWARPKGVATRDPDRTRSPAGDEMGRPH